MKSLFFNQFISTMYIRRKIFGKINVFTYIKNYSIMFYQKKKKSYNRYISKEILNRVT